MRDIKFRAWDAQNKEMCQVLMIYPGNKVIELQWIDKNKNITLSTTASKEGVELMQFTGFQSVDQCEIYENDILHVIRRVTSFNAVVKWRQQSGGFYLSVIDTGRYIEFNELGQAGDGEKIYLSDCRIIGNIFENPELHETTC